MAVILAVAAPFVQANSENNSASASAMASAPAAADSSAQAVGKTLVKIDNVVGTGREADLGLTVEVHYTGWLYDPNAVDSHGKKFDSSIGREPFSFQVGGKQVIKGWDLGVQGMKVGGKRTLIIPAEMAYGRRNVGNGLIPPNSILVFDIELFAIR